MRARAPVVPGLGEDYGEVQLIEGKTRVWSTPVLSCGGDVEVRSEGELRRRAPTRLVPAHKKIECGYEHVRKTE